ncbi:CaiB/BaiF CoA transferase family protein [Granulosicoccus antarcticus]|uniref:Acetyl-CoA:oxalate CoA-transferase n=1 Tax=Granulosicoccus antarcticus IMCC3135 TaxID=1192854 RepID=A0A2Z2NI27_9GAMM|nr:CoA transferase [Granulosicoccus antarcticus]ASJ70972.1 Acetyl-CoA:oxalate CoA-transferase [Granulosicoccus antarcticus IMCC3135]
MDASTDNVKQRSGPLSGMKVIELAHIMAGPACGLLLADMGADVIKVEKTGGGDDSRRFLPPDIQGESAAYMMMNRNKRGIALDLKQEDGKRILKKLLESADVVIENYRHDTMARLGLDYDTLKVLNPGLIYCEISGFGRTGPYRERGGFDLIAQGMSGLMSVTGEGPDRPPVKVGPPITDITAGILAAMGVSAAYASKLQTGLGQRVDTSLFEAGITHTFWQSAIAFATGEAPEPLGSAHPLNAPYQAIATQDGWMNLGAANQANWEKMLAVIEATHLNEDARFSSNPLRMQNRIELIVELEPYFKQKKTDEWVELLNQAGIPAGPILNIPQMHQDPQALAREMIVEVEHLRAGTVKTLGSPVKFHGTPGSIRSAAPLLGQHSREILEEAGFTDADFEQFVANGIVQIA